MMSWLVNGAEKVTGVLARARATSNSSIVSSLPHTPPPQVSCILVRMSDDAPSLEEITRLTHDELTTAQKTDPIRECGRAALALLPHDPELALQLAYQKLHDVPYKDVKTCWRRLYTDATLWKVLTRVHGGRAEQAEDAAMHGWIDEVVRLLDMALILTGAPERAELMELWFAALNAVVTLEPESNMVGSERPCKRQKLSSSRFPESFPANIPDPSPVLRCPVPRTKNPSLQAFQNKVGSAETHTPCIIEDAIHHWPALKERPWSSPEYLLRQTLGGRRLVPVEIGKSYTDEGWGQRIITFREFMETYMLDDQSTLSIDESPNEHGKPTPNAASPPTRDQPVKPVGYLAQHDLFAQIPSLRLDIAIPDYCYTDPAPSRHLTHIKPVAKLEEPLLNAWFGPADTVSPLHTDPYHNILAQVVGYKYVRLYAPSETPRLYPRRTDESGVDMSNTSQIHLDHAMACHPSISCFPAASCTRNNNAASSAATQKQEFQNRYPHFEHALYVEAILGPGDCLYLPVGWWHYVRSLTPSFSVSFWFN